MKVPSSANVLEAWPVPWQLVSIDDADAVSINSSSIAAAGERVSSTGEPPRRFEWRNESSRNEATPRLTVARHYRSTDGERDVARVGTNYMAE